MPAAQKRQVFEMNLSIEAGWTAAVLTNSEKIEPLDTYLVKVQKPLTEEEKNLRLYAALSNFM